MNPEEQDEPAMPPNQDTAGASGAGASGAGASGAGAEPQGAGSGAMPGMATGTAQDAPPRPGTTDVQAYIGRQLRAVYDDVVKQPIPDRFLALMKQLEEGTGER